MNLYVECVTGNNWLDLGEDPIRITMRIQNSLKGFYVPGGGFLYEFRQISCLGGGLRPQSAST